MLKREYEQQKECLHFREADKTQLQTQDQWREQEQKQQQELLRQD